MNKLSSVILAATLAVSGAAAFAQDDAQKQDQSAPVAMNDAQLDQVAAGALINVVAIDLVDISNVANHNAVTVAVPVNAAVAILGAAGAASAPVIRTIGH